MVSKLFSHWPLFPVYIYTRIRNTLYIDNKPTHPNCSPRAPCLASISFRKTKRGQVPILYLPPPPLFPVDITRPSLPFGSVRREMLYYTGGGECKQGAAAGCSGIIMLYIIYYINAGNHDVTWSPQCPSSPQWSYEVNSQVTITDRWIPWTLNCHG